MRLTNNSGSALAWQIVTLLMVVVHLYRRRIRLALFVMVTIAGSSLVNTLVKTTANRSRPVVDHPLLREPGKSFPSGHAQAAVVGYAVLFIVVLPSLNRLWRRVAVSLSAFLVAAIGFSRVALADHYESDVLAAHLLGMAWVAVVASVFQASMMTVARSETSSLPKMSNTWLPRS